MLADTLDGLRERVIFETEVSTCKEWEVSGTARKVKLQLLVGGRHTNHARGLQRGLLP
jgi:hypothetical protein